MDSFVTSDTITTFSYTPVGLRAIRLLASKIAANSVSLHSVKTEQTVIDFLLINCQYSVLDSFGRVRFSDLHESVSFACA